MTLSTAAEDAEVLSFFVSPVGLTVMGLVFLTFFLVPKAGTSFRMRGVRFPWAWLAGVSAPATAIGIFFSAWNSGAVTSPKHLMWPGIAALLVLFVGGAPLIHRLSGYQPAAAELRLRGSRTKRRELLDTLRQRFGELGLTLENEQAWRADLVARGMVKGTIAPTKRVPYMIFVRLEERGGDLGVNITAENMDIVLKDTGESRNCEVLLRAAMALFEEPPFKVAAEVDETAEE